MNTLTDFIDTIKHSNTEENSYYISQLDTPLEERLISLIKEDIQYVHNKKNNDDGERERKIDFIKTTYQKFIDINGVSFAEKLRSFIPKDEIKVYNTKRSKINSFLENESSFPKNINEIYGICVDFLKKMESINKKIDVHHEDVYNYLLKKNVCKDFTEHKVDLLKGDYLLFRYSERREECINISHLNLEYNEKDNLFTFKNSRRGVTGNDEYEEITSHGLFFRNSADTFVCLSVSKASAKFSFIETLVTLKSTIRSDNNYIMGLYSGEIISNNDYNNRPFSTRSVLIKINNKEDTSIIKDFKEYDLLRDHKKEDIKAISDILHSEKIGEEVKIRQISSKQTKYSKLLSELKRSYAKESGKNLLNVLRKVNRITRLTIILDKIKNEVDQDSNVLILKR
jgi:hypothetical protein